MKKRNTRKKRVKKGGVKARFPRKLGFQPVYDMIIDSNSQLSVLTTSSLKGFMVKLDINNQDINNQDINNQNIIAYKTEKNVPITSYILKFVIITERVVNLGLYNDNKKQSETRNDFIGEAKLQQLIWQASIEGSREELCPSVANLTICDNNGGKLLLNKLLTLPNIQNTELETLFKYLRTSMSSNRGLGILTMPNINNATTLNNLIKDMKNETNIGLKNIIKNFILESKIHLAAQVIMLSIELGIFNFDLHGGNTLIYKDVNNKTQTRLIDFGRASDILSDTNDYLSRVNKLPIRRELMGFYNRLEAILNLNLNLNKIPNEKKINFVKDILNYLITIDIENNNLIYNKPSAQISWIQDIINNDTLCIAVFNLNDSISQKQQSGLTEEKIEEYKRKNVFQNLDNPDTYVQNKELGFSSASQNESYHSSVASSQNSDFFEEEGSIASSQEENEGSIASGQEENEGSIASSQSELSELIFIPSQPIQFNDGLAEVPVTASASASSSAIASPKGVASFVSPSATASVSFNNSNYISSTYNSSIEPSASAIENPILSIGENNFNTESASKGNQKYHQINYDNYNQRKRFKPMKEDSVSFGGKKRKSTYKVNKKRNKRRVTKKRYKTK